MTNPNHGSDGKFRLKYQPNEPRDCPRCERFLDADEFHAKERNEDGSIYTRQTLCKRCTRERQRELRGHRPQSKQSKAARRMRRKARYAQLRRDPERLAKLRAAKREQARRRRERAKSDPAVDAAIRATTKRYYDKHFRSDPEAAIDKLIDARIRYRDTSDPRFLYPDAIEAYIESDDYVPIEPFLDWLATFGADPPPEFAYLVGHDLGRYWDGRQAVISLGVVDRVVTHGLGRPDLVESLYPFDTYRAGFTRAELNRRLHA